MHTAPRRLCWRIAACSSKVTAALQGRLGDAMRNLMLLCAGLAIIAGIVALKLWQGLGAERTRMAAMELRLAQVEARGPGPALPVQPPVVVAPVEAATPAPAPRLPSASPQTGDKSIAQLATQIRDDHAALAQDAEY